MTAAPPPLAGTRILVVDDNRDFTVLVSHFLRSLGAIAEVVYDGRQALACALDPSFAAVLLDIEMPVMNGLDLARRLRAEGLTIPIIAISAHAMAQDAEAALAAGCSAFRTKPLSLSDLSEVLEALLDTSTAR